MRDGIAALLVTFIPLSLLSIGGGPAILAGIHHQSVVVQGWLSETEFIELFAIARAAPGPGLMLATLIGWKVAGWLGATVATLALFLPSSIVFYLALRASNRHRHKAWHRLLREGLAPVGLGLTVAGMIILFRLTDGGAMSLLIAGATAMLLLKFDSIPTIALLALGATTAIIFAS
ncbi:chromate transporter [Ensifer sp. ENS05]|uniref:chromate transporter n=1 Tax=Ensifer sp. ENS05 TaxID=2769277 RepID=UPI00177DFE1B|nr:chromate transporter [Ensifer sp. ENS05]MBD9596413.1 chromate transporter [Ensifer sp. ENS05]